MEGEQLPMNDQIVGSLKWCWENRKFKDSLFVWPCEEGPNTGEPFSEVINMILL